MPREEPAGKAFDRFSADVREGLAQVLGSITADVMMAHVLRSLERNDVDTFTRRFEEVAASFFGSSSGALNAEVARWAAKKRGVVPAALTLKEVAKWYRSH